MSDFIMEFEIAGVDRFHRLQVVFYALREAKQSQEWRSTEEWLTFFDDRARSHFWWPTPEQMADWQRRWLATPVPTRFTDPTLVTPWDFESMIDAFRNGEYDLGDCERLSERIGRLSFLPHAWPYGGTGCMRALVESFEHRVVTEPGA